MNGIVFALGSIVFFTILCLLQRKLAIEVNNPRAMSIIFNANASVVAILIFFLTGSQTNFMLPTKTEAWIVLAIVCLLYGLFERGRFVAAKLVDASTMATVGSVSTLVAFVGSIFLYSETLTLSKFGGVLLILISLVLVSIAKTENKSNTKNILITLLVYTTLGLGWMLDKKGTMLFNASTYNILVWTVPLIFVYFPKIGFQQLKEEYKKVSGRVFILASVNVLAYFLELKAFETMEATTVLPIVQTSTIFTIVLAIFLLNEKQNVLKKLIAGILSFVGVYLLV